MGAPEVWFRIVHVAPDDDNRMPGANFRDQTIEIALGPRGAFENDNVGALTRRVAPITCLGQAVNRAA